ncbi:MAG: hypothetical protein MR601_03350 [Erysipelotrichaceae bacterium]|nr:hypothetical protein [Erysipelotrichaceae bacterium]
MKKLFILLFLLTACVKTEKQTLQDNIKTNNIAGKIVSIDKNNISISRNGEILNFQIKDIDTTNLDVDDEVSIIYNQNSSEVNVISIVLQHKASKIYSITTTLLEGSSFETLVITNEKGQVININTNNVEIMLEGPLVPGMKVKITYDSDNNLQTLEFVD